MRDIAELTEAKDQGDYVFLVTLFVARRRGNAFVTKDSGRNLLAECGYLEHPTGELAKETVEAFRSRIGAIWETAVQEAAPKILASPAGAAILFCENGRWFFRRDRAAVDSVNQEIADLVRQDAETPNQSELADEEVERFAAYPEVKDGSETVKLKAFDLNAEQRHAFRRVFEKRFVVITGGPGTGKTTTVCSILRAFLARNPSWTAEDIALVAPTARAARRMKESIDQQCRQLPPDEARQMQERGGRARGSAGGL